MQGEAAERYRDVNKIELQILDNDKEIKDLNSKITKNDYEKHELIKLNEKRRRLLEKRQENEEFLRNQQMLERVTFQQMKQERHLKNELNNQYKSTLEQRHHTERQSERRRIEEQQANLKMTYNQIAEEKLREQELHEMYRRRAISDLEFKERLKQLKKRNEQKEKSDYRLRYEQSQSELNPKSTSFKGYYEYIRGVQNKNQQHYLESVAPANSRREMSKEHLVNRGIQQVSRRSQQAYAESVNRSMDTKRDLREYLQRQMQVKSMRKSQERSNQHNEGVQQLSALKYIAQVQHNRMRSNKQQTTFPRNINNEAPNLIQSQIRRNNFIQQQANPSQSRRSSETQLPQRKMYNPITNPIDFKFGIPNPYILREYAKAKQELAGDANLKINNLALLGSSSLYRR